MSRDPITDRIEAQADAENERLADEYWDIEERVEDEEPFEESTGPQH